MGGNFPGRIFLQSVTKIVRLASPPPLFNVGCKLAVHFWPSVFKWVLMRFPNFASEGNSDFHPDCMLSDRFSLVAMNCPFAYFESHPVLNFAIML